jgi:hypothetical protein
MNNLWSRSSARSTARWVVALPLLLVGSMLFWTMALGSGAISLLAVTGFAEVPQPSDDLSAAGEVAPTATEPLPGPILGTQANPANPIVVHLQESAEPEDVNDNLGAAAPGESDDDGTGQMSGQALSPADPN